MSKTEMSHGKVRTRVSADRLPDVPVAALTAPDRDPVTKQFVKGNTASRRRAIRRIAKQLPWLTTEGVDEWFKPYIRAAKEHSGDLLADYRDLGPVVAGLCEELALARVLTRALVAQGVRGDAKALEQARGWMREARGLALSLEACARGRASEGDDEDDIAARRRAFQRRLAEQQGDATDTAAGEPTT